MVDGFSAAQVVNGSVGRAGAATPAQTGTARTIPESTATRTASVKGSVRQAVSVKHTPITTAVEGTTALALSPAHYQVRPNETPWTADELDEVQGELIADVQRLRREITVAETEIADLLRDSGEGAGDDQADTGSKNFEREHEMSLANNSRTMLLQSERALRRLGDGSYGICESCGLPIGKARLQAFPRATLCMTCKQREERR
jgi:DnaK suppressor protein